MQVQGEAVRFQWTDLPENEVLWELVINDQSYPLVGSGIVAVDAERDVILLRQVVSATMVSESMQPRVFALHPNTPNPFNPQTVIGYELPDPSAVVLTIYNLLGQPVHTLVQNEQAAGVHRAVWDGRDDRGRSVASGVYVYRLTAGEQRAIRRLVLLR